MKENTPLLSVITIVKNDEHHIESTILSVIQQKTDEVEYLVIDGNSTDKTKEIIQKFHNKIDTFISEPDTGIYDALNKGIRLARGKWIGIVHSGDKYNLQLFTHLIPKLNKMDSVGIVYGPIKVFEGGIFKSVWGWTHEYLPEKMIPHMGAFVEKSVYETYGFYNQAYRIAADYDAFLRFFNKGVPFEFFDQLVGDFNLEGVSQKASEKVNDETLKIRESFGYFRRKTFLQKIAGKLKRLFRK